MRRIGLFLTVAFLLSVTANRSALAQVTKYHACNGTTPASNEVFVYKDANYLGTCAALYPGWYPDAGTGAHGFGLPNDSLSSFKAGSGVFVKLFWYNVYGFEYWYAGTWCGMSAGTGNLPYIGGHNNCTADTPSWNDAVSSIKVVSTDRSIYCDDLQPGEFALFAQLDGAWWWSDCVVLKYPTGPNATSIDLSEPIYMGIGNDSIVYVDGGPSISVGSKCPFGGSYAVTLWDNANYNGTAFTFRTGQAGYLANMGGSGPSIKRRASSLSAHVSCNIY